MKGTSITIITNSGNPSRTYINRSMSILKEKALTAINGRIQSEQKNFNSCEEEMKTNFVNFFTLKADKAYKSYRMISELSETAAWIERVDEKDVLSHIKNERDLNLKFLVNGKLHHETTNSLYNLAQFYEMENRQELYKFYSRLYDSLYKIDIHNKETSS